MTEERTTPATYIYFNMKSDDKQSLAELFQNLELQNTNSFECTMCEKAFITDVIIQINTPMCKCIINKIIKAIYKSNR